MDAVGGASIIKLEADVARVGAPSPPRASFETARIE
jgi:hypothetical protein